MKDCLLWVGSPDLTWLPEEVSWLPSIMCVCHNDVTQKWCHHCADIKGNTGIWAKLYGIFGLSTKEFVQIPECHPPDVFTLWMTSAHWGQYFQYTPNLTGSTASKLLFWVGLFPSLASWLAAGKHPAKSRDQQGSGFLSVSDLMKKLLTGFWRFPGVPGIQFQYY